MTILTLISLLFALPAGSAQLHVNPISLDELTARSPIIVEATVGDPATVIEEVPLEEPCGSTTTTRFEFETLDVLKGGSQAPSGRSFAYPADAAMTRAMVVLMCRGDPVPSPIVDGYNGRATWESSHKVLLFLRVDSGGTYSFAVRGGFEDRGSP